MNVFRDHQRGEATRRSRSGSQEELERHSIAGAAAGTEDRITLERAIARLPPKARNALVLHDIHGFRCREIADLTGTATGTIQAHLHRARMLLKEAIGK
jgi:RNA polymerase sigma-70 factor (ECF subfamily)